MRGQGISRQNPHRLLSGLSESSDGPQRPRGLPRRGEGRELLHAVGPAFDQIDAGLATLGELREKPARTVRLTAGGHAVNSVLWPKLAKFLPGTRTSRSKSPLTAA